MITVTLPLYLLLLANAALIVAAAFAVMRVERALRESADFWASPTGAALDGDRKAEPDRSNRALTIQIAAIQRSVEELARKAPVANTDRVVEMPTMDHAVRMARRGASAADLSRSCGLNAGEAELLQRLHGQREARAPVPTRRSA